MSTEIIAVDPNTGGQKGQKPERYDLIPRDVLLAASAQAKRDSGGPLWSAYRRILEQVDTFWGGGPPDVLLVALADVVSSLGGCSAARRQFALTYGHGAIKHGDWNWRKGYPWSWSHAALHRHLEAWHRGEPVDPDSGCLHQGAVGFHLMTLYIFATEQLGTDDRPKGGKG